VLSRARVNSKNAGNRLGRIWLYLDPVLQIAVYALVFGIVLDAQRGVEGFIAWLAVGQVTFAFSQRTITGGAVSIQNNRGLLGAFAFPRLVLPVSTTAFTLRLYLNSLAPVALAVVVQGFYPRLSWLLFPPLVLWLTLFNFGCGAFAARLGEAFPDLAPALAQLFRLLFFVSMILFPASLFAESDSELGRLFSATLPLNPFYCFVQLARRVLLSYESPHPSQVVLSAALWTIVMLSAGVMSFYKGEGRLGAARVRR